jgi:aspartate-semialdehyde dehydrogenase
MTANETSGAKIPVGVLGATGSVGQRFVSLLADHPWFELVAVTASDRSAGRPYGAVARWSLPTPVPEPVAAMTVLETTGSLPCRLLFSALDAAVAGPVEAALARGGHWVVSNAKSHRMDPLVPLVVPEVNPGHLDLVARQPFDGALVTNPNCSTIGLALVLAPLEAAFGVEAVSVVTLQALSGAGIPGVPALLALDNVIPLIAGEEEKLETETRKIFGSLGDGGIDPSGMVVSAQCNRVAVSDGHTECVSVRLRERVPLDAVRQVLEGFAPQATSGLPSAPERPILLASEADRPQPRLDRDADRGMAVTVGRVRSCPLFDLKLVALSHNTLRGAAGGSLLVAELAVARGVFDVAPPDAGVSS